MLTTVRTDKWLWAARFFKTRGLAAEMCASGKVRRLGHALKAASPLHPGDILEIPFPEGPGTRVLRVISLIEKRQAAAEARVCYEESTSPGVFEAQREWHQARNEGLRGRPTKKDRRNLDRIRGFFE
ncbi:MAG: RNA-binding S4 domain-containing protein [Luteolibacter sp.]|jgi:ribosome-associated heat shock protein Hsp15|nr:RNA-binding S4 domain-containing protein [Luteolibacter sp.]